MAFNLDIPGWMHACDLRHIERLVGTLPPNPSILEIGSFVGRSAWAWAKTSNGPVHCVDVWKGYILQRTIENSRHIQGIMPTAIKSDYEHFLDNTRDCPNITHTVIASHRFFMNCRDKYDLIFIDGDHSYPIFRQDIRFGCGFVKPGGILCGHDFQSYPDVMHEVITMSALLDLPIHFGLRSTIWVMRFPPEWSST